MINNFFLTVKKWPQWFVRFSSTLGFPPTGLSAVHSHSLNQKAQASWSWKTWTPRWPTPCSYSASPVSSARSAAGVKSTWSHQVSSLQRPRGERLIAYFGVYKYRVALSFPELTAKPVVISVKETNIGVRSGRRWLTLTWEVMFPTEALRCHPLVKTLFKRAIALWSEWSNKQAMELLSMGPGINKTAKISYRALKIRTNKQRKSK